MSLDGENWCISRHGNPIIATTETYHVIAFNDYSEAVTKYRQTAHKFLYFEDAQIGVARIENFELRVSVKT